MDQKKKNLNLKRNSVKCLSSLEKILIPGLKITIFNAIFAGAGRVG